MTILGNKLGVPQEKNITGLLITTAHALANIFHNSGTLLLSEGVDETIDETTLNVVDCRDESIRCDLLDGFILGLYQQRKKCVAE